MLKTTAKIAFCAFLVAHVGIIGHLVKDKSSVPLVNLPPVNDYSTFRIRATRDGYEIEYIGNDPLVLTDETNVDQNGGVLGIGRRSSTRRTRQFTQDSQRNQEGGGEVPEGKLTAEQIACIEAAGGGRSQGALAGASLSAGLLVPAVSSIPYVGWLAAGWATLLGTNIGGAAGSAVTSAIKGCL